MLVAVIKADTTEQIESIKSLGLKPQWLTTICLRALAAYNQRTENDAICAGGSYAYFAAVRAMRDVLGPNGWIKEREQNLELTVNKKTGIRLVVSSGNKDVGIEHGFPKTRNEKGGQTQKFVENNNTQQQLDLPLTIPRKKIEQSDDINPTWMLLHYIDNVKNEMRSELSIPLEMDSRERVSKWGSRILLPSIKLDSVINQENAFDGEPRLDIKIERRGENE